MFIVAQTLPLADKKPLLNFIQEHLDLLEEGLLFLARHLGDEDAGYLDILACDCYGRTVVIEVFLQEPSASLLQVLHHFLWVKRHLPFLQQIYDEHSLRINHPPKLYFIAPSFSPKTVRLCSELPMTTVKLFEFHSLKMAEQIGILISPVEIPPVQGTISSYELNLRLSSPLTSSIELSEMELMEFLQIHIPSSPSNSPFSD